VTSTPVPEKTAFRRGPLVVTLLISILVWLLVGLGNNHFLQLRALSFSLLVGLCIYGSCSGLNMLFGRRLEALLPRRQRLARAGLYCLGGSAGYFLGVPLAGFVCGISISAAPREVATNLGIMVLLAMSVGLGFYSYGLLEERLRQSVSRLHQAELAERELEFARAIQRRLQPPAEIDGEGYRFAARNLPATFVAGDFYSMFRLDDGAHGLVIGDVSGKGMGAALIMASVSSRLPLLASSRSVAETLSVLNETLLGELSQREFVALAYARFEPATGLLELANAGLPDPYLVRAGSAPEPLEVPGERLPLGVRRGVVYQTLRIELAPGARVLFLTDGMPESPSERSEPLGYEAFAALLVGPSGTGTLPEWLDGIVAAVQARSTAERADDWTLVGLERG
jgi:serine phosphatase RsbU (regulator of sigma subunit)